MNFVHTFFERKHVISSHCISEIPAYKGPPSACHMARDVKCYLDWTQDTRDWYMVKKKIPKKLWGLLWVSDRMLVMNFPASGMVRSRYLMWKKNRNTQRKHSKACSVYRQNWNRLSLVFLGRQRPVVCCGRLEPLTNKLPQAFKLLRMQASS